MSEYRRGRGFEPYSRRENRYDGRGRANRGQDGGDRSGRVTSGRRDEPSFRGRGRGGRDNRQRRGRGGGKFTQVFTSQHRGVFVVYDEQNTLVTKSLVPGIAKYGEKRVYAMDRKIKKKIEYRVWDPLRSKLAAAIYKNIRNIYIHPGSKVLYLGAASGTAVSHVADIVGVEGTVFAVESAQRHVKELVEVAQKRSNIIPILEEAWHPYKYRMLLGIVDVIVSDVARPDQVEILAGNAQNYLKVGGYFVIFIKASCTDPSAKPKDVLHAEIIKLEKKKLMYREKMSLEERDDYIVVGVFRPRYY